MDSVFHPIEQNPPCKYYGNCGGCSLQHLKNHAEYKTYKINEALEEIKFSGILHPIFQISKNSRRRVTFSVNNQQLSFYKKAKHETVKINNCLLLEDDINKLIQPINILLKQLSVKIKSVSITKSDTGMEILFSAGLASNLNDEVILSKFAHEKSIGRIAWQANKDIAYTIIQLKPIALKFDSILVNLPINCFLQVSSESNEFMNKVILKYLNPNAKTLELFCGIGSFSIAIQTKCKITAIEGNKESLASLTSASRTYNLPISTEQRDLFQNPCNVDYLKKFEQVIINPPRNGASPQIKNIANTTSINKVILISCSLENFIRDAKLLINADFYLAEIFPIDQFVYSEHIEIIAIFTR